MTKAGSFKRAARQRARETGTTYTEALAALEGGTAAGRVYAWGKWRRASDVPAHLERRYGIRVDSLTPLSPHGVGVFKVSRHDGPPWVARIFPPGSRSAEALAGDVEILLFLQGHGFPSERCAHAKPLSVFGKQHVLVTEFVAGESAPITPQNERAIAAMLGRLHTLPMGSVTREGGAWGHDPAHAGAPREDLRAAAGFLDAVEGDVPEHRVPFDALRDAVAAADTCEGLPAALTTPHVGGRNVVAQEDDTLVLLDWKPSGVGERLASFATLLQAAVPPHGRGGAPDVAVVDAIVSGYREHVVLTADERSRLADVIRIHPLYFASWRYWRTVGEGHIPDGSEPWWPDTDVTDAIAERVIESLASPA